MEIRVVFEINTSNHIVPWEIQHKLDRLRIRLKKYIIDKYNGKIVYDINADNEWYDAAKKIKDLYPSEIDLVAEHKAIYTKEELEKAVAFIPDFEKIQIYEYGDDCLTHFPFCEECGNSKLNDKLIANPEGKTKILHNKETLIKCGDQIDEVYGISKFMFDNISDSYLKKGFKPIYSMRGKEPFGYGFYGESEIELFNDNYDYTICESCGTIGVRGKGERDRYCEFYVIQVPDFEKFPVCFSQQYYLGHQKALVSPELYKYIISRVKKAEFIPVFMKEQ